MKKKRFPLVIFIIGIIVSIAGISFLLIDIFNTPTLADAEYLVKIGKWVKTDAESVVWNFTDIGTGNLTTNNHKNDYDFIWALEGNTLKIETNWAYPLENTYIYKLDQKNQTLTLATQDHAIVFTPQPQSDITKEAEENTETPSTEQP